MEYFGTNLTEYGHYRFDLNTQNMVKMWTDFKDLPFNPEELTNNLPKGDVAFYQGGGFTVLGISGSCKDERPGTKSIFWVKEIVDKYTFIQEILQNSLAMKIIHAMPFEVRWQS